MTTRRQRLLLTAAAVAGAVALYGCGGGDSGPDQTPFNQADVDKAAADARKKAEMEAAAAATAMAEAGTAAAEAKKAMEAAAKAKTAAAEAAKYAMTATLDMAKAMAASANASAESGNASAAAKAARAAAVKAGTAAAGHQAARDAEASAKAAEKHAMEAEESATAAMRSYETAKSVKGDRDATGGLVAAAGAHAEMAKQQATAADKAAMDAMARVKMAKDATTEKAAEDARTAATKARVAADKAYEAADAAADEAERIESDAAAVKMSQKDARDHAKAAMMSRDKARMYFDRTAGYADARRARDEADAGKKDVDRHADYRMRVPWIAKTTTENARTALENAAKAARTAAEGLERTTIKAVIDARKDNIASALSTAMGERARAEDDLMAAVKVHDAARPFSEDGMAIDADNPASGKTLRHPSGRISVNRDDAQVYAADQKLTELGPYDVLHIHGKWGVVSYGNVFKGPSVTLGGNITDVYAKYQVYHYNRWNLGAGLTITGPITPYKYVSFGVWGLAKAGYIRFPQNLRSNGGEPLIEAHSFVFADMTNITKNIPNTGTASYLGNHQNYVTIFAGNKGTNGADAVITDQVNTQGGTLNAGDTVNTNTSGMFRATIDFSTSKVDLFLNNWVDTYMYYDVTGIDLNRSTGTFSGGTYRGRRGTGSEASRTNRTDSGGTPLAGRGHDPFKFLPGSGSTASFVPTMKLHGGIFGPKSDEIAGTIHLTATIPHGEATHPNLAAAKDGRITVHTSFAGANQTR